MELAIEVEGLTSIEVNADAIKLALKVDTMMVLNIIGISSIATSSKLFDVVVLLVFLQCLILGIGQHHFCISTGRVGARLAFVHQRNGVFLLLLLAKIGQEAKFVEGVVLIQVIQLTRNLFARQVDKGRAHFTIGSQREYNGHISAFNITGIGNTDSECSVGKSQRAECGQREE